MVSAKQRVSGSVRKGDEPPQSHHPCWHPGRAGSTAWAHAARRSRGRAWREQPGGMRSLSAPGAGTVQKRPDLDLLGAEETEGNDREELSS